VVPEGSDRITDPQTAWLDDVLACLAEGAAGCADRSVVSDAARVDRIARLEHIKAAAAALQMAESVRFAQSQVEQQLAADVHPDKIGRGIADQLGLACHLSGFEAARRLGVARALWFDLPETFRLLTAGQITEYVASLVVSETRHLDARTRGEGYLPAEQGVACLKSLRDQTDALKAAGDPRCRDQIMADTLVERLTGQANPADVNVELQIVMGLDALLDANNQTPAELNGYGPLPAELARDLLATSKGKLWWRRLYAAPVGGPLVGGDPYRRHFDSHLERLIRWRDRGCRDPFCDAPIRHIDHIQRYSDGGLTIYPNGRGTCERGNYARLERRNRRQRIRR
jgi:hypothetical protein